MSDELFVKFNEFMKKGYINYDAEQFLAFLKEKGLEQGSDEYNKEMGLYTSVAMDRVLKTLLPELSSYDLSHEGTDIKTLYDVRKRELDQKNSEVKKAEPASVEIPVKPAVVAQPAIPTAPIEAPVAPATAPIEVPTEAPATAPITPNSQSTDQKIAMTEAVTVQEPSPSPVAVQAKTKSLGLVNPDVPVIKKDKNINYGYANIVLMSIIVMIIVAIICVFIFL